MGKLLLANSWIGLLTWFPTQLKVWYDLHSYLVFLVRLTKQSELDTILSSVWGIQINFSALAGQQGGPQSLHNLFLGNMNWARLCTEFPGHMRPLVYSAEGESHRLWSLFKCHCKWGCWMNYTASHVFCLGFLVGWAEGCIQQWGRLWISFPAQESMRTDSKSGKAFHLWS